MEDKRTPPESPKIPSEPQKERPSFQRVRKPIVTPSIANEISSHDGVSENSQAAKVPSPPSMPRSSNSRSNPRKSKVSINTNPMDDPELSAIGAMSSLSNQKPQNSLSPLSVTDIARASVMEIYPESKPFYDILCEKVTREFVSQHPSELSLEVQKQINTLCFGITMAIAEFKDRILEDPLNLCRSANKSTLWTEKRHLEIKELQKFIKPYFDVINSLISHDFQTSESSKNLYSSQVGRNQAAQLGPILEMTPFGKILESKEVHAALKESFGPNAFRPSPETKQVYKEVNGEIVSIDKDSAEDLRTSESMSFTIDSDTAVVIGVWEAVSSSFAQGTVEKVNIYVPFGINSNSVVWNHELAEIRKNHANENIFIHTLNNPEEYHRLDAIHKEKKQALQIATDNHATSDILFSLRLEVREAQKSVTDYLNETQHWEEASIDKSNVKMITRTKEEVPLQTVKKYAQRMREMRDQVKVQEGMDQSLETPVKKESGPD